jgi:hypothetical protein
MSFADWKGKKQQAATATVATLATDEPKKALKNDNPTLCVADVASVAVAVSENKQKSEPPTKTELLPNSPVFGGGYSVILANTVKCNQCEYLSLTGTCKRLDKRVIPEAIRECDSFKLLKSERLSIVKVTPYTATELLTHYEKPLFNHLLACPYCHVEKAQYCLNGYAMGSVYDALLLNRDDAQARRESLALQVDRACISGRSVYVPFKPIPF